MELEYIATFAAVSVASIVFFDIIRDLFIDDRPKEPPKPAPSAPGQTYPPPPARVETGIPYPAYSQQQPGYYPPAPVQQPGGYYPGGNGRPIDPRKLEAALQVVEAMEERGRNRW